MVDTVPSSKGRCVPAAQAEDFATVSIRRLETRLRTGANGTEPERLGARMDHDVWCARAIADFRERVHQVHRRYIDAGAHVITTNSYSATREAMQRRRLGEHFGTGTGACASA